MVWAGIVGDQLIGPFFFEANVTGQSYLDMLQNNVLPALNALGLNNIIFQHDGAPPHFTVDVREWLDITFDTWIGRGGDLAWPARSPNFNQLDFFLWSYIKNKVYQTQPANMDDLKQRIQDASQLVTPDMLLALQHSFRQRLNLTFEQNGGHVEQLL